MRLKQFLFITAISFVTLTLSATSLSAAPSTTRPSATASSVAAPSVAAPSVAAPSVAAPAEKAEDKGYKTIENISYSDANEANAYKAERCRLDIYYPENTKGFATLVWFHGGGLTGGSKGMLDEFRRQGFAVVNVNYRLYPQCKCPEYIEDAAQSVAWVMKHISEYGGDPAKVFVGGHSAGGYLTLMVALAPKYMAAYGADADKIAKAYPVSGQTTTHYTIRKERGIDETLPIIDEYAPSNNVRKEGAPLLLITGDRDLEMMSRYEENLHLYSLLKHYKHPSEILELSGFDHGTVLSPACLLIRSDIKKLSK